MASETETYLAHSSGAGSSQSRLYNPVIEYAYTVDGQEYHNLLQATGGSKTSADAEVAAHPVAQAMKIHYDSVDPTRASLGGRGAITLSGRSSLVVGMVSFALAYYLARY